ncbi:MAG: acyl-CoA/acyl-ACP dehydrogenase, partial [Phenylobacterium sp.]|uniref:acyl-CoA dehydrogenase family protein n=1 Tax=Phenylobacterium sp. TaxID=1871053 RepID=UPI001A532293
MRFALSEDQGLLQDSLNKALAQLSPLDRVRRFADGGEMTAPDIWAGLSDAGLPGLLVPEEFGGLGLGLLEAALAAEALGKAVAPTPFLGSAVLAPLALTLGGSAAQKAAWLPKLASGEATAGVAISEPIAGAREGAGVTASGGKLTGKALFALDAPGADLLIVADHAGGLHLAEPVEAVPMASIDATRRLSELTFKDTPAQALNSNQALERLRDAAWTMIAADTLGA